MKPLTVGSLFAGIGGLDLGLERAGMVVKWQVEIDEYCRRVLAKHWPDVKRYEDVREVGAHNLEPVDVICGGFPCQDVSRLGKRAGIDGERSGLWREYARIVREVRPRYVVVENVAMLLSDGMGRVLGDLAAIGYDAEWSVLSACAVGAPHTRERVFILAYPSSLCVGGRRPAPTVAGAREGRGNLRGRAEAHERRELHALDQPRVLGSIDAVPDQLDRNSALGNAVVPEVARYIGNAVVRYHEELARAS